jgi:hypothetical protein
MLGQHERPTSSLHLVRKAASTSPAGQLPRGGSVGRVEALGLMLDLAEEIDTAIAEAVQGLRAYGYSWAEIGARLGSTRQAAQQRWGTS